MKEKRKEKEKGRTIIKVNTKEEKNLKRKKKREKEGKEETKVKTQERKKLRKEKRGKKKDNTYAKKITAVTVLKQCNHFFLSLL